MGEIRDSVLKFRKMMFSFLFQLIVQIQSYCGGGEVGHCGVKVSMFSFCVSLVFVHFLKSVKRAEGLGADVHFLAQEVGVHMAGTALSTLCKP